MAIAGIVAGVGASLVSAGLLHSPLISSKRSVVNDSHTASAREFHVVVFDVQPRDMTVELTLGRDQSSIRAVYFRVGYLSLSRLPRAGAAAVSGLGASRRTYRRRSASRRRRLTYVAPARADGIRLCPVAWERDSEFRDPPNRRSAGKLHALAGDTVGPVATLRRFGACQHLSAMTDSPNIKPEARRLVESLPDSATWDDLAYEIYVRQSIEAGLADADAGRVVSHDDALARVRARIRRAS